MHRRVGGLLLALLVLVMVGAAAAGGFSLEDTRVARPAKYSMCIDGQPVDLFVTRQGLSGSRLIFDVAGRANVSGQLSKEINIDGSMAFNLATGSLHWGLVLVNSVSEWETVAWELNTTESSGNGTFRWLTASEQRGSLSVVPFPCGADSQSTDLTAFGWPEG